MQRLVKMGFVSHFTCHPNISSFYFNLGKVNEIEGLKLYEDFTKYQFKVDMSKRLPEVYPWFKVENRGKLNHFYHNGSLCLYNSSDYDWTNQNRLDQTIIPWTFMWMVYYKEWEKSGVWVGPEYPH